MNTGLNYNVLLCVCAHVKMFGGFVVFQLFCITITFDCIQVATFREFGWEVHLFLMNIGIELCFIMFLSVGQGLILFSRSSASVVCDKIQVLSFSERAVRA